MSSKTLTSLRFRYFATAGGQAGQAKESQLNELFDKLKGTLLHLTLLLGHELN